jgi:hypothetical protein
MAATEYLRAVLIDFDLLHQLTLAQNFNGMDGSILESLHKKKVREVMHLAFSGSLVLWTPRQKLARFLLWDTMNQLFPERTITS